MARPFGIAAVLLLIVIAASDAHAAISVLWSQPGAQQSSNIVASMDGRSIYYNTANTTVCKLDASTGHTVWCSASFLGPISLAATGELKPGLIPVTNAVNGTAATLSSATGQVVASTSMADTCPWQWLVPNKDHTVYTLLCDGGGLYGLNATLGQVWFASPPGGFQSNFQMYSTNRGTKDEIFIVFFTSTTATVIGGFNMKSGATTMPLVNFTSAMEATAVWYVHPNRLLVGGASFDVATWAVYDATTGVQSWNTTAITYWENTLIADAVAAPDGSDGIAYVFLQNQLINASLAAMDVRDGSLTWSTPMDQNVTAVNGQAMITVDSSGAVIFLLTQTTSETVTTLWAFDAKMGKPLGSFVVPMGDVPLMTEGLLLATSTTMPRTVYVSLNSIVYAFQG